MESLVSYPGFFSLPGIDVAAVSPIKDKQAHSITDLLPCSKRQKYYCSPGLFLAQGTATFTISRANLDFSLANKTLELQTFLGLYFIVCFFNDNTFNKYLPKVGDIFRKIVLGKNIFTLTKRSKIYF